MLKFIILWIAGLILISIVVAELLSQFVLKFHCKKTTLDLSIDDDIDKNFGNMRIENYTFAPMSSLQKRGSWRIAQDQVLCYDDYKSLEAEEYRKYLK
ncbi:MAG: hypothetical protein IJT38_05640 [Clostridia bacterium]|nr:hypothetical protein [Clostridia bacterium]